MYAVLTVQAQGDVDGADVAQDLEVGDVGTLELRGGGRVAHVDPADRLLGVDKVHGHGLLGGDGGQAGGGAAERGAADVVEVGDQQHRQSIHRVWIGGAGITIDEKERRETQTGFKTMSKETPSSKTYF